MATRILRMCRSSKTAGIRPLLFHNTAKRCFSNQKPLGFIGCGQMGGRMAKNLLEKSNNQVIVYDKYPNDLYNDCIQNGAKAALTPREVAESCDTIVTMLRSDDQVREVYTNKSDGLVAGISSGSNSSGKLLIDSSTINFSTSKEIAEFFAVDYPSVTVMDCPVSGGVGAAAGATLTFMVGGPKNGFENAKIVLECMGKNVFHCGEPHGSGQIAKICNNLILAISMCGVSEGMNLGVKLGMDPKTLAEIVNVSSGRCWSSDTYNPCPGVIPEMPPSNDYNGGFVVDLMRKDLQLALNAAQSCQSNTPLASNVAQLYDMISNRGHGNKDFGFMYQFIKGSDNDGSDYKP